jgi:hypothetical protein
MPAAEAWAQTTDASRYLIRLCKHAGKMRSHLGHRPGRHSDSGAPPEILNAEWSESSGFLILSLGRCILGATDGLLTIRVEASTPEDLARIQELITKRLEGFGRRDGLTVTWQPAPDRVGEQDEDTATGGANPDAGDAPRLPSNQPGGRGSCAPTHRASATHCRDHDLMSRISRPATASQTTSSLHA